MWLGLLILCWKEEMRVNILILFQILVGMFSVFHHLVFYWVWVCYKCLLLYWVMLFYTHFDKSYFFLSWMGVECCQMLFMHLLGCSCHFFPFCLCVVSCWWICICWPILMNLGWVWLDIQSLWCVAGFNWLIFCQEFLDLYSSKILTCYFIFWLYIPLVFGFRVIVAS